MDILIRLILSVIMVIIPYPIGKIISKFEPILEGGKIWTYFVGLFSLSVFSFVIHVLFTITDWIIIGK